MKIFLIIFTLSFVSFSFFISWVTLCYKNGLFEVRGGESLFQIAENLKKQEFIQMEFPFYSYVLLKGKSQELKSGVYLLTSDDTFFSIAKKIIQSETYTLKITIPEGFTVQQIQERLINPTQMNFELDELLKHRLDRVINESNLKVLKASRFKNEFDFLNDVPDYALLEGFLFPDTYYFYPQRNTEEIVKIFFENFDKKLTTDLREEITAQGKSIFQIITMASLIEKEVKTKQEKELVSGVLWKRLEINMPLQVDCDIETYEKPGLPIGPICNPGLDSILAAVYPEDSNFWYYLSTPDGETIFSQTLKEHNIAKAKYLK